MPLITPRSNAFAVLFWGLSAGLLPMLLLGLYAATRVGMTANRTPPESYVYVVAIGYVVAGCGFAAAKRRSARLFWCSQILNVVFVVCGLVYAVVFLDMIESLITIVLCVVMAVLLAGATVAQGHLRGRQNSGDSRRSG